MRLIKYIKNAALVLTLSFICALNAQSLKSKINEYIKPFVESKDFSGSILIADKTGILYQESFGFSNFSNSTPNNKNTIFGIGSISKQFTAVAILKLEEKGLLTTDVKINKFLPEIQNVNDITIHHLLSHTSGLPTNLFEDNQQLKIRRDSSELLTIINNLVVQFEPGEKLLYSNVGYTLLSIIIEKVSQSTFHEFLIKELFIKAKMSNTYHNDNKFLFKDVAEGYDPAENKFKLEKTDFIDYSNMIGAGSLFSNTIDLHKWNLALHKNNLLSKESYKKLTTSYKGGRGYGIGLYTRSGEDVIGHDGVLNGFHGFLEWFINEEKSVIYLGNIRSGFLSLLQNNLSSFLFNEPIINYNYEKLNSKYSSIDSYIGDYELFPGLVLTVEQFEGRIRLKGTSGYSTDLTPLKNHNEFFYRAMFAKIKFEGANGSEELIWIDRKGNEYRAEKMK